jgi:hypothetical protein
MKQLFWICWSVEMAVSFFWIADEIKIRELAPNPWSFVLALYLMMVLAIRFGFEANRASALLVALPAMPLLLISSLFSHKSHSEVKQFNSI